MSVDKIMKNTKKYLLIAIAALLGAAPLSITAGALAGAPPSGPIEHNKQIRQLQEQEFLSDHSDSKGNPRPDLWRKGVEQQKHMQVAPYIGWHPTKENGGKPVSGKKN